MIREGYCIPDYFPNTLLSINKGRGDNFRSWYGHQPNFTECGSKIYLSRLFSSRLLSELAMNCIVIEKVNREN